MSPHDEWILRATEAFTRAELGAIFFKEIPNEYCGPTGCEICAEHPWLLVATRRGVFKFGWRKRVMVIDWSSTSIKLTADELFPDEDVTKSKQAIHAWGYEKATAYFHRLGKCLP